MLKKVLIIITSIMCISLCSCGGHTKKSSGKLDSESVTYSEKDSKTDIVATLKYDNDETHNLIIGDETHEICGFTDDLGTINKILSEYVSGIEIKTQYKQYLDSDTCDCFLVLQECSVGQIAQREEEPVYNLGKCYMLVFVADTSTGYFSAPLCLILLDGFVPNIPNWYSITGESCYPGLPVYTYGEDFCRTKFPSNNILLSEEAIISLGWKERQKHIEID